MHFLPGGAPITITGQGFGLTSPLVTLGGKPVVISSFSDVQLVGDLPSLGHGEYSLFVYVEDKGYADLR